MRTTLASLLTLAFASCTSTIYTHADEPSSTPEWVALESGIGASLRGLSAVDQTTAWASGQNGTVLRTVDSGATWTNVGVQGAESLDFRDIHASDSETAIVLSAGEPAQMYKTIDAGATWQEVYANDTPGVFFDAMAFWSDGRGLAFSDPIDGHLLIIRSDNHGDTWRRIDPARIPPALEGEAGFAASGTCLAVAGDNAAWIGLGGPAARVFLSTNNGEDWSAIETPLAHSASAGIFSLAIRDDGIGVAIGGDYTQPDTADDNAMHTTDGGRTWTLSATMPRGYRSAVVVDGERFIATGPNGTDVSFDDGRTWQAFTEGPGFHAIDTTADGAIWAVGSDGRIGRIPLTVD